MQWLYRTLPNLCLLLRLIDYENLKTGWVLIRYKCRHMFQQQDIFLTKFMLGYRSQVSTFVTHVLPRMGNLMAVISFTSHDNHDNPWNNL